MKNLENYVQTMADGPAGYASQSAALVLVAYWQSVLISTTEKVSVVRDVDETIRRLNLFKHEASKELKEAEPLLSEEDLFSLGYQFKVSDLKGDYWEMEGEDEISDDFHSKVEAVRDAEKHALGKYAISRCANCATVHTEEGLEDIRHYSMRVLSGETVPSGQCNACGSLCYPLTASL